MNISTIIVFITTIALLGGCVESDTQWNPKDNQKFFGGHWNYFQDENTDLCFVTSYRRLAHVPCTDKVLDEIRHK